MRHTLPWYIGFASVRPNVVMIEDSEISLPVLSPDVAIAVLDGASESLEPAKVEENKLYASVADSDTEVPTSSIIALRFADSDLELLQAAAADVSELFAAAGYKTQQWYVTSQCSDHMYAFIKVWYKESPK